MRSVILTETPEYVSLARYSELCVNELALRLNHLTAEFDLSHERDGHLIIATIDDPATGEKRARALSFADNTITDLTLTRL